MARPLILESSPPVLTVGRRCKQEGYEFHWPRNALPYMVNGEGVRIVLKVENFVPYIDEGAVTTLWTTPAPTATMEPAGSDECSAVPKSMATAKTKRLNVW